MLKDKLNAIRVILGLKVNLEEAVLIDGVTKVSAEKFEAGYELSVVAEDGTMSPAPEGTHETEDMMITVDAKGVITAVEPKETEEETTTTETTEVAAADAPDMDAMLNEKLTPIFNAIEEMVKEIGSMKEDIAAMKENFSKFSKTPAGTKVPKVTKAEDKVAVDPLEARLAAIQALRENVK